MNPSQLSRVERLIRSYLGSDTPYPFFASVDGSDEYGLVRSEYAGLSQIRLSSYCEQEDSFPNIDRLIEDIRKLDSNCILYGVGESAELGCEGSDSLFGILKDMALPHKLIVLCRGVKERIRAIDEADPKFNDRRFVIAESPLDYYVTRLSDDIPRPAEKGFRKLLSRLELGPRGEVVTKSALRLKNVQEIRSCYMMLNKEGKALHIDESALPDECWRAFLEDSNLEGHGIRSWQTYLKLLTMGTDSPYLNFVISRSPTYEAYKTMLVQALLDLDVDDQRFNIIYEDRKLLLKNEVTESEMALYVSEAKRKGKERIFYLTDMTDAERRVIIEEIAKTKEIPANIGQLYSALASYLFDYAFTCSKGELFTSYFSSYKRLKLLNTITPDFLEHVLELAKDGNRVYNELDARNAVVERSFGNDSFLLWVDALGVEYLGFIQDRARALGLSMSTTIARASLPTLTSFNRGFFDSWGGGKQSLKKLDELKHGGEERAEFKTGDYPVHIVEELDIVEEVLSTALQRLASREYSRVVIASDHGASRLAVIHDTENKWSMQTKGQHAGRCCPCNEIDERPQCATEENGFWVLANYDRFKGGRKANVEVHGGASLEEVLVPVVVLSLRDASIKIECLTDIAFSSFKEKPTITLFSITPLKNPTVRLKGRVYTAVPTQDLHYEVRFDDVSRIGKYSAEVYEGDDLIDEIEFTVQKRTAKTNDDDWFD